jgi:hypothetical protein
MTTGLFRLSCRAASGCLLGSALAFAPSLARAEALGVEDPVVSFGLSGIADWSIYPPFLNLSHMMRPIFAYAEGEFQSLSHEELVAQGYLDAAGYPLRLPQGMQGFRTIWAWDTDFGAAGRAGTYVLTHKGTATMTLGGDAQIESNEPGRIVFRNEGGGAFWLDITDVSADDPLNALSILRSDHVPLAEAGALFDPAWLAVVADARELRFMDWMNTNNSTQSTWNDRPKLGDATWSKNGTPVEVMVRLANEAGVDPWFNMPHMADADYVRGFATYVRDNLDPRLKAHVEYSNEYWNGAFDQFHWLHDSALAEWGDGITDDWEAIFAYNMKRATEVALIWEDVFGKEADSRLVNILGTQTGNNWLTEIQLGENRWQDFAPQDFIPASEGFEELAGVHYFGGELVTEPDLRREILDKAAVSSATVFDWLYKVTSGEQAGGDPISDLIVAIVEQREIANSRGLRFVAYEGGQHMHHSFAVDDLSETEAEALSSVLEAFVRSPEMGALYSQLWEEWRTNSDGPFMQFVESGTPSRWGSWGLFAFPGDRTPRADVVMSKMAEGGSWWGEGGGPQYLQGITALGTNADDQLTGTDEEDYLATLAGNDRIIASGGKDGINGGDGTDSYILPGPASAFRIDTTDKFTQITGPEGSADLFNIELIEFADGTSLTLD